MFRVTTIVIKDGNTYENIHILDAISILSYQDIKIISHETLKELSKICDNFKTSEFYNTLSLEHKNNFNNFWYIIDNILFADFGNRYIDTNYYSYSNPEDGDYYIYE